MMPKKPPLLSWRLFYTLINSSSSLFEPGNITAHTFMGTKLKLILVLLHAVKANSKSVVC
jgi:hypothetical protein